MTEWIRSPRHEREVATTTVQLMERLEGIKDARTRAYRLEEHLREVVNAQLDVLIALVYELDIDEEAPELRAAISRGSLDQCVVTTSSFLKRQFAELCREQKRAEV